MDLELDRWLIRVRDDSRMGYFIPSCASGIGLSPGARVVGKPSPSVQVSPSPLHASRAMVTGDGSE